MGNENSQMKNIIIDDKYAEKCNNCLLYDGNLKDSNQKITIFEEESNVGSQQGYLLDNPLSQNIKNLKIYRHPSAIVKYFGSYKKNSSLALVTERVKSLNSVLSTQTEIQICLGIRNILSSLIFLVESANCRHLSITISSVFVTENNTWKLLGFEHVFKSNEVTKVLLQKSKSFRSNDSIDPNEDSGVGLEQYAFAVFCEHIIKKDSQIPYIQEFLDYCKIHLKHANFSMRPSLSAIQLHEYFNHDFIKIHGFLSELALKSQNSKQDFFKNLNDRLRQFDENIVGSQLSELLLSRLVLLEPSAAIYLMPFLLKPQNDSDDDDISDGLFSMICFTKYVIPKLMQVFCVLDVQIRLILLEYFPLYVNVFTREDLIEQILPQLLLGIKDTNDLLVTKTLLCLADLIPILGATAVIGSNRRKLFADGRPQQTETWNNDQPRSITPVISSSTDILLSNSPTNHIDTIEVPKITEVTISKLILKNGNVPTKPIVNLTDDELNDNELMDDEWGWDQEPQTEENGDETYQHSMELDDNPIIEDNPIVIPDKATLERTLASREQARKMVADNIDELDIKNKKLTKLEEKQADFFSDFDMAPKIQKCANVVMPEEDKVTTVSDTIKQSLDVNPISIDNTRFQMSLGGDSEAAQWDDGTEGNWDDD